MKTAGNVVGLPAFWRVHLGRWSGSLGLQDLPEVALVLWSCVPSFCPLSRFVLAGLSLKYAFIRILRAFLARFGVVVRACVVLVLCVACGAFVCVSG